MKLVHPLLNAYVRRCNAIKLNAMMISQIGFVMITFSINVTRHFTAIQSSHKKSSLTFRLSLRMLLRLSSLTLPA